MQNKAGFPGSDWNEGSSFNSEDERMSEYPVETIGKALVPHLISTGCLTSF